MGTLLVKNAELLVTIDGSPTVIVNNLQASRQGDTVLEAVGPPNKIAMGCFTVIIGQSGSGPGGGGGGGAAAAGADALDSSESLTDSILDAAEQAGEALDRAIGEVVDTAREVTESVLGMTERVGDAVERGIDRITDTAGRGARRVTDTVSDALDRASELAQPFVDLGGA